METSREKEILCQQLELLAERSKNCDDKYLSDITMRMLEIYSVLSPKEFSLL